MFRIYGALIDIFAALVFIIPVFLVYGKFTFHNAKRTFTYAIFACYLVAVLALVGFPNISSLKIDFNVNIIPFAGMIPDFKNACLNVLMFVPLGVFLPLLWEKYRNIKDTIVFGLCATAIIEITQVLTFRATDINDIITNILGALIGYCIAKWASKNFTRHAIAHTRTKDLYLICGTVVIIMFFVQPFVASLIWDMML